MKHDFSTTRFTRRRIMSIWMMYESRKSKVSAIRCIAIRSGLASIVCFQRDVPDLEHDAPRSFPGGADISLSSTVRALGPLEVNSNLNNAYTT